MRAARACTAPATEPSEMYRVNHTARETRASRWRSPAARESKTRRTSSRRPFRRGTPARRDRCGRAPRRCRHGGPVAPGSIWRATSTLAIALADVERHRAHADLLRRVAQQIRGADVAAAGQPQIDAAMAASQQVRERNRPEQYPTTKSDGTAYRDGFSVRQSSASRERDIRRPRWRQAAFVQGYTIDPRGSGRARMSAISADFRARDAISKRAERQMRFEGRFVARMHTAQSRAARPR